MSLINLAQSETKVYSDSKPYQSNNTDNNKSSSVQNIKTSLSDSDDDVIKVDSTLVTIPVSVSDRTKGSYVSDLTKNDFKIFENDVEQEIAYFGNFDKPFTVILILDTSPSTAYKIEEIQSAAKSFVDQLKPQDRVEIIKFNQKIRVLAKATKNREKIYKAIEEARFESGTSLYDVVNFALRERLKNVEGRKAIVLFTDGVDTTSEDAFFDGTVSKAEEADTLIFPVYYDTLPNLQERRKGKVSNARGERPEDHKLGRMYLQELATSTGGRIISPELNPNGLKDAFKAIAEELSYQYNIGYYPAKEGVPGEKKDIKVRVFRPNLNVRARDNYTVKNQ